jgi:FKBP-type peptidyl-prolyl cis-trans isomerase FkpA/FKBP-type peptidyl-prolyl cis-trans isomerase FklB
MTVRLAPAVLCLGLVSLPAFAAAPAAAPPLTTDDDKTFYALGSLISKSLEGFQLTPKELELVKAGIEDGVTHKPAKVDIEKYGEKVNAMHQARVAVLATKEKAAGDAYIAKVAAVKGATKTATGIVMTTLTPGTGVSPKATDEVKVHYEGKLINGTIFDSSLKRGEPASFPLNGVIPCWTEAVQLMKVGGKSRIVCPSNLAYGERGSPPSIGPNQTLIFEVQLLEIAKPAAPAVAPAPAPAPKK